MDNIKPDIIPNINSLVANVKSEIVNKVDDTGRIGKKWIKVFLILLCIILLFQIIILYKIYKK
jgi:hypothetical protein